MLDFYKLIRMFFEDGAVIKKWIFLFEEAPTGYAVSRYSVEGWI